MRVSVYVPENADKTQKQEFLLKINMLDEKNSRTKLDKTQKHGQMSARFHFDYAKRFLGHYKHELAKSTPGSKEFREFGELVRVFEQRYDEARERLDIEHEQARRRREKGSTSSMSRHDAYERLAEPDRAFLRSVADLFGRPDAITIRFADGGRYDGGKFRNAQDYDDFRPRSELLHQRWLEETRR